MLKTDLARELFRTDAKKIDQRIARTDLRLDEQLSKKTGKPAGRYITIESDIVTKGDTALFPRLCRALSDAVKTLADPYGARNRPQHIGHQNEKYVQSHKTFRL